MKPLVYFLYTDGDMIPASLALCILLGLAVGRLTRRRRVASHAARSSEVELDRFIADLARTRDRDATEIVRPRRKIAPSAEAR